MVTTDKISIRRFEKDDAQIVADLIGTTLAVSNSKDYPPEYIKENIESHSAQVIEDRANESHFYVAVDGDTIIGCGGITRYWGSTTESYLVTIFVLPEYQHCGIGRKIIETLEADEYFKRAWRTEVGSSLTAVDFYRRLGYQYKNNVTTPDEFGVVRLEKTKKDTFARKSIQIKIAYMLALIGKLADSLEIISDIGVEPFRESFSGLCYYQKPNGDKYEGCDSIILFELYYQTFHLLEMEDACNYVKAFFKMAFNNTPANRATFPIEILYTESFYQESVVAIPYLNHTIDLHKLIDNYKNLDEIKKKYHGEVTVDHYGRAVPRHAHGTSNLPEFTSSTKIIMAAMEKLFDRIINWNLLIRRINVVAANVIPENKIPTKPDFEQMDLFTDYAALEKEHQQEKKEREKLDTKRLLKKLLGSPMKKLRSMKALLQR